MIGDAKLTDHISSKVEDKVNFADIVGWLLVKQYESRALFWSNYQDTDNHHRSLLYEQWEKDAEVYVDIARAVNAEYGGDLEERLEWLNEERKKAGESLSDFARWLGRVVTVSNQYLLGMGVLNPDIKRKTIVDADWPVSSSKQ